MKKKLSISIFAYKQAEQIKAQLNEIINYGGEDIEIVISDDTPDDSIKKLVMSYDDERLKYIKNKLAPGADGNYLNAIKEASSDYVWIFRSSDCVLAERITDVIQLLDCNRDNVLYFLSSDSGEGLRARRYKDEVKKEVWHSGTLHPSGYIINKKYCDFDLYEFYIKKYFEDYKTSNVAFSLLQADLGLKGNTLFSSIVAWKYALTVERNDKAHNAPGGKNPFGLEFEYKRYALMLDYANNLYDESARREFINKVIHTFAKQILHIFGKRNSSEAFLNHYGCERVEFSPYKERRIFIKETKNILEKLNVNVGDFSRKIQKESFVYGVVKPTIYAIGNKK